jgi:hypothetical protein
MLKTTLYLPEDLKEEIRRVAEEDGTTEAAVIRETLRSGLERRRRPHPRTGLFDSGDPRLSQKVDELLKGFGDP